MIRVDPFAIDGSSLIKGLHYEPEISHPAEESALSHELAGLPLKEAEYKQYRAKRRIQSYGGRYDYNSNTLRAAEPIAGFLHPILERVAHWTSRRKEDFTQALVAEYSPGTQLGWHRDVPDFELVVGVSLAGYCRMRFRRYPPAKAERPVDLELAPRSIYRLEGAARWEWQHCVPPVPEHRYSITFRTSRISGAG